MNSTTINNIILILIVILLSVNIYYNNVYEHFTYEDETFAKNILIFFNTQKDYINYLSFLTSNNNYHLNLVDKKTYNYLNNNNKNLSLQDVLNEMY